MTHLRMVSMALVVGLLSGCATTKPEMPDAEYARLSKYYLAVNYCNWKGWITPDVAASGKRLIDSNVSRYSVDLDRFNREAKALNNSGDKPSQGDCNQVAMSIQEQTQTIAAHNQAVVESNRNTQDFINSTKIQNTYCNRIGTQTFCNTY